jgi:thiamine-phosphate pyrophosphorylase
MNGLLFITHRTETYDDVQSAEVALKGGCRQIQLRMKDEPAEEVERTARRVKSLCDVYGARLYVDDHVEVCRQVGATGVHLGKRDMPPGEARKILGSGSIIGGTANTFDDIRRLADEGVDYIGLGPFRFTTTKKNLSPVLGLEGYRDILSRCKAAGIHLPVLAIGGVTIADIPGLMQTGISGIALSSTILQAEDPVAETQEIITCIKKHLWIN